ncbi:MAG: glycosyltransferase family 2 protein [Synergistes sp.]|nr:glycosyltransferase family 2 protein [Synergistes sp.]
MKLKSVSVLICTYNPIEEKLAKTLDSVLMQKDVDLQVVISDDGSENNLFGFAKEYFKTHNFSNYKLVAFAENNGTTKNVIQGLEVCVGNYVKAISPGDCLAGSHCLSDWTEHLHASGKKWSFGDIICYTPLPDGSMEICVHSAHPQTTKCYSAKNDRMCRWNYVVFNDITNGASTICETQFLMSYVKKLAGKVIYAEDNSYRLMMFDGFVADYYPQPVIFYEYGSGISTLGDLKWKDRLRDDWYSADDIMFKDVVNMDDFQKEMMNTYIKLKAYNAKSKFHKMKKLLIPGWLKFRFRCSFTRRMTLKTFSVS